MRLGVLFDSYDETGPSNMGENFANGPLVQSFTTSAATTSLNYAILYFLGQPAQTLNTIAAALLADASGQPGTGGGKYPS